MVVNLAQAYKWGGKPAEASKIIEKEDWTSCSADFQLAVAVLKDDFERAASLMKAVAAANLMRKNDYRDWPLFNEFRKSPLFIDAYNCIYGHHLVPIESSPTDVLFGPYLKLITETEDGSKATGKEIPEPAKEAQPAQPS
jgi:hypothetical protein